DCEEEDPRDEEPPASQQVGEPTAEQEHTSEEDRVGGNHPLQVLLAEIEVGLDRWKCDVHDRHVQDDHELGRHDQGQGEPRFARVELSHLSLRSLNTSTIIHNNDRLRYSYS